MTGLGAQSNAYDANGNLTKLLTASGTTSFTYDARRRLCTATVPAGWSASYGVNGLGQRVSKSAASLPTGVNRYFYDNDGNLLGEYDATGARIQEISYLAQPGEGPGTAIPVAINRAGAHYFINPDHLNSARSIGYANGQNVWTRSPSPFGEDAPNQNPNGFGTFTYNPGPFPGQYRDSETGLAYNMLRDYAPKAGRYVQSDPIGLAGGSFSTYGYVGENPVGRVDPWGLAFVARRPLSGLPWFGPLSMGSVFGTNAALSHAQIFFEDRMSPSNLGFFEDSTIHYGENAQEYHLSSGHYNDCVMRSAVAKLNYSTKYSITSNNCQDWVGNVLQQYDKLMMDPMTIAQCFFQ